MQITTEMIGYVAATLTTGSFVPQAVLTLKTRNTDGLSFGMYGLFALGVAFWLVYGLLIHNDAIIVANAITLLLSVAILSVKIGNSFKKNTRKNSVRKEPTIS